MNKSTVNADGSATQMREDVACPLAEKLAEATEIEADVERWDGLS